MPRSEEQKQAGAELEAAILKCAQSYELLDDGEIIGDFIVVSATQLINHEGEVEHSYITLLRGGTIASTSAVGLLETASFDIKRSGREL